MTEPIPYKESFPTGTEVRVADSAFLENFKQTWKYHHRLDVEQLAYADQQATVEHVAFYHGGDPKSGDRRNVFLDEIWGQTERFLR